jgi:hypothetical protein
VDIREIEKILLELVAEQHAECDIINGTRHYRKSKNVDNRLSIEDSSNPTQNVGSVREIGGCIE